MTQHHEQFLRMLDTTGVERPVNVIIMGFNAAHSEVSALRS